ncbi:hypothetical protein [Streptomyces sp. NBC_00249]|uniref:hypothetical protein n=1 Tax=Streptomyces sp. NBC_00249 TaxID=2975690 RepID=UPI002B1E8696|nr:hypothetical protein [Streptomyces sp. NBC_00249]
MWLPGSGGLLGTLVLALSGVALAAPGDLDPSFDTDGKVTTDFGGDDAAHAVALQTDGKITVVGAKGIDGASDFALARYNTNGSLDTSFGTDGMVTTDFGANDGAVKTAVQADGRIVAVGVNFSGVGGGDVVLARYNTGGSLDTSFDTDGKVTTDFGGGFEQAWAVALQTDGRLVTMGDTIPSGPGGRDWGLVRYNTDGSLDTNFNGDGKVTTDFTGTDDQAFGVAVQADGKIVAAGSTNTSSGKDIALARYAGGGGAPPSADVSVTKAGPGTASLGDQASYAVTVTNNSATVPATGVTLDDTLTGPGQLASATSSQGTCTTTATSADCALGTLAPGASATVTVTVEPTATGTLTDIAAVSATEPDLTPANNTATATTTVNNAHGCTIAGTLNADSLVGTNGNDILNGGDGNDTLTGGNGTDTLDGGNGTDTCASGEAVTSCP